MIRSTLATLPTLRCVAAAVSLALILPTPLVSQAHDHATDSAGSSAADSPAAGSASSALAGQAAFGTIAAIVAQLEADPAIDWSRVDIEALRQHLIDMDRVVMDAVVESTDLPTGARFEVEATGPAIASIQRMTMAHARALDRSTRYRATATTTDRGAVLEVVASDGSAETIAKIQGLGFAGLLTIDDHHARHHRMLASGAAPPGH